LFSHSGGIVNFSHSSHCFWEGAVFAEIKNMTGEIKMIEMTSSIMPETVIFWKVFEVDAKRIQGVQRSQEKN
jgi:hypothetical protein